MKLKILKFLCILTLIITIILMGWIYYRISVVYVITPELELFQLNNPDKSLAPVLENKFRQIKADIIYPVISMCMSVAFLIWHDLSIKVNRGDKHGE